MPIPTVLESDVGRLEQSRRELAQRIEYAFDHEMIDAAEYRRLINRAYGTEDDDRPYFDEQRRQRGD